MATLDQTPQIVEPLSALRWPPSWTAPTRLQRFLLGVPFVGLQHRVRRELERQLLARGPRWGERWRDADSDEKARRQVAAIIQEWLEWPNDHFIPEDPLEILLWDWRAYFVDDLVVHSAVVEIETQLELPRLSDEEWERLLRLPFGDAVRQLLELRQR